MATVITPTRQAYLNALQDAIRVFRNRRTRERTNALARGLRQDLRRHFESSKEATLARLRKAWPKKTEALSASDYILIQIYDVDTEGMLLAKVTIPKYLRAGFLGASDSLYSISQALGRKITYRGSRAWVHDNATRFGRRYAREISETTNAAIRDQLGQAMAKGENLDQVMGRIAKVYADATGYRSEMIGRTEMGRGYNMSALTQEAVMGIDEFDWFGCDPACTVCGPFMQASPHKAEAVEAFILDTHPNCVGNQAPTEAALAKVPDSVLMGAIPL